MSDGRDSAWHNGSRVRRSEIILRAESWLRPSVPYHRHRFHHNEHGIYRTDSPGYVSMAWAVLGVPPRRHGGLGTVELAELSDLIDNTQLRAGDAILRTEAPDHAAIFHEWVDSSHVAFWGFELAAATGTVHRTIEFPYDDSAQLYVPRRYRLLTD